MRGAGTIRGRAGAVAVGLLVDAATAEPPDEWHPVARFGAVMTVLERRWWRDSVAPGAAYAAAGVAGPAVVGSLAAAVVGPGVSLAAATAVCAAAQGLLGTAAAVGRALEAGDVDTARAMLPALAGRDPDGLDEKEIARAVVESVAENLSDAVVATAFWGVVAGAPGALVHRAANTLDAMVGHHSARYERFGRAAARLDDVLGWPAARVTAVLVAAAAPRRAGEVWRVVRRDAAAHPSPNAGVAEAAVAGALGLRLGGVNRYGGRVDVRPPLGDGRPPEPADVAAAVALGRRVVLLLAALLGAVAVLGARPRHDELARHEYGASR